MQLGYVAKDEMKEEDEHKIWRPLKPPLIYEKFELWSEL